MPTLLLTPCGRKSGQLRPTGLIYVVRARPATAAEKPLLWRQMATIFSEYERYQAKAGRDIPVVILEPSG